MEVPVYNCNVVIVIVEMVIVKSYYMLASKIKLSATKVNGFQNKSISTRSSIIDIAGVPDPPLITIFGKVIFNLTQATVILFNLIAINGRNYLNGNYETIFYKIRIYTPAIV